MTLVMKAERAIFDQIDPDAAAAGDARAEADIRAGRVIDHGEVTAWACEVGNRGRAARSDGMARIVWTREALINLELIRAYIQQFDPGAARRMATRLIDAGDSLSDFPERGRDVGAGVRELVTVPPYILRYRLEGGTVYILRVRHGAREPD